MGNLFTRVWRYLVAALTGRFEEAADPKVQIEQAIAEAQNQHRQLTQRAASVIANQKKAEMDLDRSMQELEKLNSSTRQAILMAEEAQARGDEQKATEYTQTAETFANRLVAQEQSIETLKQLVLQSTGAADQAKQAVDQNARRLQERLSERQKLLSQLDQAKMQEQMNAALESVSATVGRDVPSLEQVRDKIETRYAQARGERDTPPCPPTPAGTEQVAPARRPWGQSPRYQRSRPRIRPSRNHFLKRSSTSDPCSR